MQIYVFSIKWTSPTVLFCSTILLHFDPNFYDFWKINSAWQFQTGLKLEGSFQLQVLHVGSGVKFQPPPSASTHTVGGELFQTSWFRLYQEALQRFIANCKQWEYSFGWSTTHWYWYRPGPRSRPGSSSDTGVHHGIFHTLFFNFFFVYFACGGLSIKSIPADWNTSDLFFFIPGSLFRFQCYISSCRSFSHSIWADGACG